MAVSAGRQTGLFAVSTSSSSLNVLFAFLGEPIEAFGDLFTRISQ